LERVLVVQRALRIGFTLAELADVLKARDAGGAPCRRVYQLAQEKLKGIEADIIAMCAADPPKAVVPSGERIKQAHREELVCFRKWIREIQGLAVQP
jgi:DNA-binding transcriptional MerR regulator